MQTKKKMTVKILNSFFISLLIIIINSCDEKITEADDFQPLEVEIRMEVQILDSIYNLYSRPFTKIYFTTYKLGQDNRKYEFEQSDTTSCQNGWGVKILNYTFENRNEKIILGAACDNYDGSNYREIIIDYEEAQRRINENNYVDIIKTFAIYYK